MLRYVSVRTRYGHIRKTGFNFVGYESTCYGWTAAGHLKANPDTKEIHVIALTAHAMAEDKEKALAAGCDDFDTKPVDFKGLREKIDKFLGNP